MNDSHQIDGPQDQQKAPPSFPVVGIGASAGGLTAIKEFLEHMPAKNGMAFVVILHLSPKYDSSADQILQRSTRMPVVQVTGPSPMQPDHVYVISPRHELTAVDGHLDVAASRRERGPHVAIDIFFRTLADAHRDRAVGVILSGTGSDGTVGIARLKEKGGVTLAQSPEDSEYDDMPRSAIGAGHVDFVLPVAEMPQKLLDIWGNAQKTVLPAPVPDDPPLAITPTYDPAAEQALHAIVALLAERSGHDFSHYKRATMLRRMERRMQVRLLKDLPSYLGFLADNPDEVPLLLADMLISVTNFFRDRESFEALERDVIPGLFANDPDGKVRAWVPGCATGEEAYSLAMLLAEESARAPGRSFQIFASDIDESAIAFARNGVYPASIITDVTPGRAREFFTHKDNQYRIKKNLRERVLFAVHNMLRDPPFSQLDLISCRNVLIYLNRDIQTKLLEMFHFALKPGGILFLGSSESADGSGSLFHVVDKKNRIFASSRGPSARRRTPVLPLKVEALSPPKPNRNREPDSQLAAADIHHRILEEYAPPSVIVDAQSDIVHMSDRAGRYLRHKAGVPSHNVLSLVRTPLRAELRSALLQANHAGKSVEARRVKMELDGKQVYVNIVARPFEDAGNGQKYVLVLFQEVDQALSEDTPGVPTGAEGLVAQLEAELERTKNMLQATIENSDAAGEELRASNEELQAINEELRSASEELETSKEELQSVNEELTTVNAELKCRIDETAKANDDLTNFITASDIATLFIDSEMRIRRYTPRAELIFSLIPTDVGRNLMDITHRLEYPTLVDDVSIVIKAKQLVEREVQSIDGRWLIARLRPYQRSNDLEGAVLTFFDVTNLRIAERRVRRSDEEMRKALAGSLEYGVITMDEAGSVVSWNSGAETIFGFNADEMTGMPIDRIFVAEDVSAGVPAIERETARSTGRAEDNRWHQRKDGTRVFCRGVMTPLSPGNPSGFAKIIRDATSEHQSDSLRERQLQVAQEGLADAEAHAALKDDFLAVMSHELKHPLNLINVNTAIIGRLLDPDAVPAAARALTTINRAVRAQTRIIDDLLDLSRIRTGKLALDLVPVDMVALAQSAVETARADAGASHVTIDFSSDHTEVQVHADPTRLSQMVWNLLNNAIKFTPPGGHIQVRVLVKDECGCLEVTDNGQGIDPESLSGIFEMFGQARARAASRQPGLGIGLALVKQLAVAHGGRVEVHSEGVGKGACFTLWLPLDANEEQTVAGLLEDKRAARCEGMRILVVDDDQATAETLQMLLELEGAQVTAAIGGAKALQLASSTAFDLIISDLGMPDMDGYELLLQLKAVPALASIPVIALTGFGRDRDVLLTEAAGFAAHVAKPVSTERLISLIGRLVNDKTERVSVRASDGS